MAVAVIPLQWHLGVFSFGVVSEEGDVMQQVFCRAFRQEWYRARRNTAAFKSFRDDMAAFRLAVLDEVGVVHDHGKRVDRVVLEAVAVELRVAKRAFPNAMVDSICTGFHSEQLGWVRSTPQAISICEDPTQPAFKGLASVDLPADSIRTGAKRWVESVASRHRAVTI